MKSNCWDVHKCGRTVGGTRAKELGVCPAATTRTLDGVHEGQNAGRACWVVAGTLCGGQVQASFANKFKNCQACDFYQQVQKEEAGSFKMSAVLLQMMRAARP